MSINKHVSVHLNCYYDLKAFTKYFDDMDDIYEVVDKYSRNEALKIFISFDDMIANMLNNKKINPIVTELFIRGKKLNISLAFIKISKNQEL